MTIWTLRSEDLTHQKSWKNRPKKPIPPSPRCSSGGILQRCCKGKAQEAHFLSDFGKRFWRLPMAPASACWGCQPTVPCINPQIPEKIQTGNRGGYKHSATFCYKLNLEKREIYAAPLRMIHRQACPRSKNELKAMHWWTMSIFTANSLSFNMFQRYLVRFDPPRLSQYVLSVYIYSLLFFLSEPAVNVYHSWYYHIFSSSKLKAACIHRGEQVVQSQLALVQWNVMWRCTFLSHLQHRYN